MSWNGSGSFNRLFSWVADAAAGLDILASRMDSDTNNITSNGFGNCLTRDGQGQPTANLPMAGFRHTGVQNGVSRSDYAALGQVQDGTVFWTTAGGTADAITATYTPAITALVDGQLCGFRASGANTTTLPTFSPNGLTARNIVKNGGGFLNAGDIAAANSEVILRYNAGGTFWELLNPATIQNGSVQTASIANSAVTYAKIQNVAASRLLGNPTGAPAAPSEISLTAADLAFSGTALKLNTASITIQTFTSGSGTYTTPANVKWLEVRLVGGGGGGGGGQNAAAATNGGNTTFSTFTASGGAGGSLSTCGTGGAASGGNVGNYPGGGGGPGTPPNTAYNGFGGQGGNSYFGGGGAPTTGAGGAGATNTGGGGGGGGATNVTITGSGGCGGGSGGTVIAIITSPAASYSYAVGASGAGAAGGSSGSSAGGAGGAGAAGKIEVIEHYAN